MHPGLASVAGARRVLVLGGGDGLAVREILKYPQIERIVLVDLDPEMTRLFSANPLLTALNERLAALAEGAGHQRGRVPLGRLGDRYLRFHRRRFSGSDQLLAGQALHHGVLRARSGTISASAAPSSCRARRRCSRASRSGASTKRSSRRAIGRFPYHVYVPSFGEWGFVLAVAPRLHAADGLAATACAFSRRRACRHLFEFPVRHGPRLDARQPPERSGAGAHARVGVARDHAVDADAPRVLRRVRAALVGLSIKGDRPLAGAFVNDDMPARPRASRPRRRSAPRRRRFGCPSSSSAAAWPDCQRRLASAEARLRSVRAARNERAGGRQLALGRERDDRVSVGRALRAGPGQARDLRARAVRGAGRAEAGWQLGGASSVLRAAGAAVPLRPMAGGHRAGGRTDRRRSRTVPPVRRDDRRRCGRRAASRCRSTRACPARTQRSIALSFAAWLAEHRFDSKPLLWYANYACRDDYGALASDVSAWAGLHYFASRDNDDEGTADLAGGQRLDRQAAAGARRAVRPPGTAGARDSSATVRRSAFEPGDTEYRLPTRSFSPRRHSWRRTSSRACRRSAASSTRRGSPRT